MEGNNKIEKFFEKKFSSPIVDEDWNRAPEDSWDNILQALDEKPHKRRFIIYIPWLLAALALVLVTYLYISNENQSARIETLENKINDIDQHSNDQIKTIDNNATAQEETTSNSTNNNKNQPIEANLDSKNINSNKQLASTQDNQSSSRANTAINKTKNNASEVAKSKSTNAKNELKSENKKNNGSTNSGNSTKINEQAVAKNIIITDPVIPSDNTGIINPINIAEAAAITSSISDNETLLDRSMLSFNKLNQLKLTQMLFPVEERTPIVLDSPDSQSLKQDTKQALHLGLYLNHNNWVDKNTGIIDNPLEELLTQENTLSSFSYGINASYNLSKKWSVNLGALYNQRSHESTYLLHLPFSKNTEILDAEGDLINAFQHSLPTSLGNVQTDVTLARSQASTIGDDEIVDVDLSFKNQTRSILIPLNFSYFPREANNGLFFSAGLANEIIIGNKISEIQSESLHSAINDKAINVQYSNTQQNRYGLGANMGLGYVMNIKSDLNIMLSANYTFALSNNYMNNGYQHKIDNLSFGLGLMKEIGR